jgi:hypothetical protein
MEKCLKLLNLIPWLTPNSTADNNLISFSNFPICQQSAQNSQENQEETLSMEEIHEIQFFSE